MGLPGRVWVVEDTLTHLGRQPGPAAGSLRGLRERVSVARGPARAVSWRGSPLCPAAYDRVCAFREVGRGPGWGPGGPTAQQDFSVGVEAGGSARAAAWSFDLHRICSTCCNCFLRRAAAIKARRIALPAFFG